MLLIQAYIHEVNADDISFSDVSSSYILCKGKKKLTLNMENVDSKLRDIGSESFAATADICLLV